MQILLLRYTVCLKRVAPVLQLEYVSPLSANPTKWPNTLKTIRRQEPTNCLSVCDLFVGMALKGSNIFGRFFVSRNELF